MNLNKLNPWNWFRHEDGAAGRQQVPVTRKEGELIPATRSAYPESLLRMHNEIDRLFDQAFSHFSVPSLWSSHVGGWPGLAATAGSYRPQLDVSGDAKHYEITLDVPGLAENDLSIEVSGDILTVRGQKEESKEDQDKHFYRIERSAGSFVRTLSLPDDSDVENITASLKKGILKVSIPRKEGRASDSRQISIES